MKIAAYIRPGCKWSDGVCQVLEKYALDYTRLDIEADKDARAEMVRKSGQNQAPCIDIDGVILGDASGEELENYLLAHELVHIVVDPEIDDPKSQAIGPNQLHRAYVRMGAPAKFF
jgi:glutaredoxin